jgi:hypothetical protein
VCWPGRLIRRPIAGCTVAWSAVNSDIDHTVHPAARARARHSTSAGSVPAGRVWRCSSRARARSVAGASRERAMIASFRLREVRPRHPRTAEPLSAARGGTRGRSASFRRG